MSDVVSAPIPGRLYDIGPAGEPVPARVVALPDGTLCWLWSAHGDLAVARIEMFANARPLSEGEQWVQEIP